MYKISIRTTDTPYDKDELLSDIKNMEYKSINNKSNKRNDNEDNMIIFSKIKTKKNKQRKKDKKSLLSSSKFDIDENKTNDEETKVDDETLMDIRNIINEREDNDDIENNLTSIGKGGYKNLKKNKNNYKKEFAEELTLLYALLDETSKFGKSLEKDLSSLKGSKIRGVSKYTNDLAQLILNTKQNKLNILKEIAMTKKTIADLTIKSEKKQENTSENSPERLASAYYKNILANGRTNFIDNLTNREKDEKEYESLIDIIEKNNSSKTDNDDFNYDQILIDRLEVDGNPYRSEAGTKYIEYEGKGVKLYVKKCIDTGEWEFVAIDKNKQQIDDYPLPTKRDAGRMRFSDDGTYCTDSKGRIYNVIEYMLPPDEEYD